MDRILSNGRIATMESGYGLVEGGIAIRDGRIEAVGPEITSGEDLERRLVTPGLIDCHTHLVFGGNRAREFEMRLEGASYEELARAGGGIMSTVHATRAASEDDLVVGALPRLDALIAEGVTTVEIKSGYGLTVEDEIKMLRAARRLEGLRPICSERTFLGPHAVPPEYEGRADAYIDEVCLEVLEREARESLAESEADVPAPPLFTAVDAFCEGIAFTADQCRRFFDAATNFKHRLKIHAEQLSNLGGTRMAAEFGDLISADHVEYLDQEGVHALAANGATAVLLPGAFYTLRETQLPPVQALRDAGVPIAIATDCNPGSSPMTSLLLAMNMACTLFRMMPEEVLTGVTRHAAGALGLPDRGRIAPGLRADLAIWDVEEPAELAYRIGFNPLHRRIFGGEG